MAITREELSIRVRETISYHFSNPLPSESNTWDESGWYNDSLDELDFLMDIEKITEIKFDEHQELLRNFYDVNLPIKYFIDDLYSCIKSNQSLNGSRPQ